MTVFSRWTLSHQLKELPVQQLGQFAEVFGGEDGEGGTPEIQRKFHGVNLNPLLRRALMSSCILRTIPFALPVLAL
jgi:hypothetical protein